MLIWVDNNQYIDWTQCGPASKAAIQADFISFFLGQLYFGFQLAVRIYNFLGENSNTYGY